MPGMSYAEKHAEHLVKTSLYHKDSFAKDFFVKFSRLKASVLATLTIANDVTTKNDKYDFYVGQNLHTSNTEVFSRSMYDDAVFDDEGKVVYSKFSI